MVSIRLQQLANAVSIRLQQLANAVSIRLQHLANAVSIRLQQLANADWKGQASLASGADPGYDLKYVRRLVRVDEACQPRKVAHLGEGKP